MKIETKAKLAGALAMAMFFLMGSALTQPPVDAKGFRFTLAGTPLTVADVDINLLQFGKGPTCAVTLINDNAGGGNELLFAVSNNVATAAAGADGATGSATIVVRPGETMNMDGRFTHIVVRSSAGNTACRIIPNFDH